MKVCLNQQLRVFDEATWALRGRASHSLRPLSSSRTTNQLFVRRVTSVCFVMERNCARRHVPERAFNRAENADARSQYARKRIEITRKRCSKKKSRSLKEIFYFSLQEISSVENTISSAFILSRPIRSISRLVRRATLESEEMSGAERRNAIKRPTLVARGRIMRPLTCKRGGR